VSESQMILIAQWIAEAEAAVEELPLELQGFKTGEIVRHLQEARLIFQNLCEEGR
jgi:hypothetical protein